MHIRFERSKKRIKVTLLSSVFILITSCSTQNGSPDAQGNFETDEIRVSSQESGILMHYTIIEGKTYKNNQYVGILDTIPFHLQKEQIRAQIKLIDFKREAYQAELSVLKAQLAPLMKDLERMESLLRSDAITRQELDHMEGKIDVIRKQMEAVHLKEKSIRFEKNVLEKQILQVCDRIRRCAIINPIEGTVLTRFVQQGELIPAGRVLYTIASLDTLILRGYVSGNRLSTLKLGDQVSVFTDRVEGQKKHNGIIRWISSESEFTPKQIQTQEERVNLVYAVKIYVPNPDGTLKIGMPADIYF